MHILSRRIRRGGADVTIIAYKDGVMAADTATFQGDLKIARTSKIVRRADGALAGASGRTGTIQKFNVWFLAGASGEFDPKCEEDGFMAIMISAAGIVSKMNFAGEIYSVYAPFYANGAPEDFALGAMAAGASAEEAVKLCIEYSDGCGGDVQVEEIGEHKVDRGIPDSLRLSLCQNDIDIFVRSLERGFKVVDAAPHAYARTGEPFLIITSGGIQTNGFVFTERYKTPEEAVNNWWNRICEYAADKNDQTLYWRVRPRLECDDGLFNVYSRLLISREEERSDIGFDFSDWLALTWPDRAVVNAYNGA